MNKTCLLVTAAALGFSATANAWWAGPGWNTDQDASTPYFYGFGPSAPAAAETQPAPSPTHGQWGFAPQPRYWQMRQAMHQHMRQRHEQWRKLMEQRREDMRRQMHQRMRCLTPDCPGQTATRPDAWREALETRREAWRERMQKRREQRHQWMLDSQIRPPALEGLGSSRSAEPATGVKKKTGTGAAVDAGQAAKTPDQEGEGQTRPQTETQAAPVEAPTPDTQPAIGELEADAQSAGAQRPPEAQTEGATKEQEAQSTEPGASSSAEDSAQEKGDAEPKSTSSRGVPVSLPRPIRV